MPLMGKVSAQTGTRLTLDKINTNLRKKARELTIELKIIQLSDEAKMVKAISRSRNDVNGVLINPGALACGCFALRELLAIVKIPTVEIHVAEFPYAQESFDLSAIKDAVQARFLRPGGELYATGLDALIRTIGAKR